MGHTATALGQHRLVQITSAPAARPWLLPSHLPTLLGGDGWDIEGLKRRGEEQGGRGGCCSVRGVSSAMQPPAAIDVVADLAWCLWAHPSPCALGGNPPLHLISRCVAWLHCKHLYTLLPMGLSSTFRRTARNGPWADLDMDGSSPLPCPEQLACAVAWFCFSFGGWLVALDAFEDLETRRTTVQPMSDTP